MTDHAATMLDGAHRDYAESGDAMRWKPTPEQPRPTLVSVRDAAHLTEIPVRTIQRWVLNGWATDRGDGMQLVVALEEIIELAETRRNGRLPHRHPTVA